MKYTMRIQCQTIVVLTFVLLAQSDDNERKMTKLWSVSGSARSKGPVAIVNVTGASISVEPTSYPSQNGGPRQAKVMSNFRYAFKPRAVPVTSAVEKPQARSVYYSQENVNNNYKKEILFPGNYFPIPEEKSNRNVTEEPYNPMSGGAFHPKAIPLMRVEEQGRSLRDDQQDSDNIDEFLEPSAQRRSLSYIFGEEGEEEEEDAIEPEEEDVAETHQAQSKSKVKPKPKKLTRYMLPLLLAYKLKYFALVPVLVSGLILIVGAAGLAGFFFALFAAVMGLQKGGGY